MRILVVLAVAVVATWAPAPAAADDLPDGKLALVLGLRDGADFDVGAEWGFEAAWQPIREGQRLGYGIHWSMIRTFPWFELIRGFPETTEMSLGVRLRFAPRVDAGRFLTIGGGVTLLRTATPLPPDDRRDYWGPFASFGIEQIFPQWRDVIVGAEVRYGVIVTGPPSLTFALTIGAGI